MATFPPAGRRGLRHAAAILTLLLAGSGTLAADLLVVSQTGADLARIDASGGVRHLPLDAAPAGVAVDGSGTAAAVSHPDLGRLTLVDLGRGAVARSHDLGGQPFGLAFTGDGRLLVTDWAGGRLSRIDPASGAAEHLAVGAAPSAVVVDAARGLAYTVDRESDRVSRVDLSTFTVTATAPTGRAPFAAALSSDGARLHVANVQSGDLSVVDTATMRETARVAIGGMPYGVAVDPASGRVLVTDQEGGRLVVVDAAAAAVERTIRVGDYPEAVVVDAESRRAHVANWFSDTVSQVDLDTLEVHTIAVAAGPRMLALVPGPSAETGPAGTAAAPEPAP